MDPVNALLEETSVNIKTVTKIHTNPHMASVFFFFVITDHSK